MACSQKGIVFASVHDSFWTHAADVPAMNATIRDKFIDLHENCDPSTGEPKYILSGECQTRRQADRFSRPRIVLCPLSQPPPPHAPTSKNCSDVGTTGLEPLLF